MAVQWTYDGYLYPYKHETFTAYKWDIMSRDISKKQAGTGPNVHFFSSRCMPCTEISLCACVCVCVSMCVFQIFDKRQQCEYFGGLSSFSVCPIPPPLSLNALISPYSIASLLITSPHSFDTCMHVILIYQIKILFQKMINSLF